MYPELRRAAALTISAGHPTIPMRAIAPRHPAGAPPSIFEGGSSAPMKARSFTLLPLPLTHRLKQNHPRRHGNIQRLHRPHGRQRHHKIASLPRQLMQSFAFATEHNPYGRSVICLGITLLRTLIQPDHPQLKNNHFLMPHTMTLNRHSDDVLSNDAPRRSTRAYTRRHPHANWAMARHPIFSEDEELERLVDASALIRRSKTYAGLSRGERLISKENTKK